MATIKDIARISGYSIGTVSRVINNHPDVSEEAKKKIQAIIEEQKFQPNANAKHLKLRAASDIAVVVKGYGNALFAELIEEVQSILHENGEEATLFYLDENADEVTVALQIYEERHPKGFLFLGGGIDEFREKFKGIHIPSVLLTNSARELNYNNLSSYSTDDADAAATALRQLIRAGHTKIAILGGDPEQSQIASMRLKGAMNELKKQKIDFDLALQYEKSRFSMAGGYTAASNMIKRFPEVTAIFALSDTIAIGAIRAFKDLGKRIPEDISVVGFDGIESGQYCDPRLSTIHQDIPEIAKSGVRDLLMRINYKQNSKHELIPFQFIRGNTIYSIESK